MQAKRPEDTTGEASTQPTGPLAAVDAKAAGERIRSVRKARGWSAAQLAKRLGASHGWVSLVERGEHKKLDADDLDRFAHALSVPADYLRAGQTALEPAAQDDVDRLVGRLRTTLLIYGQPTLERASRLVDYLDNVAVIDHQGPGENDGNPMQEISSLWELSMGVSGQNGRAQLAITPFSAHQIYSILLRSARPGDRVRCTSAVTPDWWTKHAEGQNYHDLNLWKAQQDNVEIRRLMILQSESHQITTQPTEPAVRDLVRDMIVPQLAAGIVMKEILWGAVPDATRKDMMIVGRRYTAWSDLQRVGEPSVVHISDVPSYVEDSARDFDAVWDLAKPINPDLLDSS